MTNPHRRAERLIEAVFELESSPEDERWRSAHVRDCAPCRARYDAYAAAERALFPSGADAPLTPASRARVEQGLGLADPPSPRARSPGTRWAWIPTLGLAAALGALAFSVLAPPAPPDGLQARGDPPASAADAPRLRPLVVRLGPGGRPQLEALERRARIAAGSRLVFLATAGAEVRRGVVEAACGADERALVDAPVTPGIERRLGPSVDLPEGWGPCELTLSARFLDEDGRVVARWRRMHRLDGPGVEPAPGARR